MTDPRQDLDAFLTAIESKLRAPFSSLDFAKAVQTAVLRKDFTAAEYLHRVRQVLDRTDKVTQARLLVGVLGLDVDHHRQPHTARLDNDDGAHDSRLQADIEIDQLLSQAQEAPQYEEWVRVIAGLVQGILYGEQHRGEEANEILERTVDAIIERVRDVDTATATTAGGDVVENHSHPDQSSSFAARLMTADADPLLAPYRYALLNQDLLEQVMPALQSTQQAHFSVSVGSDVLQMDMKLERAKAQEEQEHSNSIKGKTTTTTTSHAAAKTVASTAQKPTAGPVMPGARASTVKRSADKNQASSSSMFLAARKPTSLAMAQKAGRGGTGLHVRKAGAAQGLVGKGRGARGVAGGSTGGTMMMSSSRGSQPLSSTVQGVRGRALGKMNQEKSKMKLIDVAEVQDLANEQKDRQQQPQQHGTSEAPEKAAGAGHKRKAAEPSMTDGAAGSTSTRPKRASNVNHDKGHHSSAASGASAPTKEPAAVPQQQQHQQRQPPSIPLATAAAASTLASAALSAYQAKLAGAAPKQPTAAVESTPVIATTMANNADAAAATTPSGAAAASVATVDGAHAHKQQDWRQMLKERSNRLSVEDRLRIQKFFVERVNPTPDQGPVYKMKLHEERTTDAKTGEPVKETYYLELNYTTFSSKQSKKVKRYKDNT